jgi:hypothetical protein
MKQDLTNIIEMMCILSHHNAKKLVPKNKSSIKNYANNWRLSNTLLNYHRVIEEIREENKKFLEFNENENTTQQNLWTQQRKSLQESL